MPLGAEKESCFFVFYPVSFLTRKTESGISANNESKKERKNEI